MRIRLPNQKRITLTSVEAGLFGFLVLLICACILAAPQTTSACGRGEVVRDYRAPLKNMRSIQRPPISGELPFAPIGVKLGVEGSELIAGQGSVGFVLSNNGDQARHLSWIVETQLLKVNRRGSVVAKLGVRRHRVLSMSAHQSRDFLRTVPGQHAFYRMDIRFLKRGSQQALGAYSTYARAVPARAELRMEIETPSVFPGEYAHATLVNSGTVPLEFRAWDFGFRVNAFTGEKWIYVPPNPPRRTPKLLRRTYYLPAGVAVRGCLRYLVSSDQAPGLFRFIASGTYDDNSHVAEAQFQVVAP